MCSVHHRDFRVLMHSEWKLLSRDYLGFRFNVDNGVSNHMRAV